MSRPRPLWGNRRDVVYQYNVDSVAHLSFSWVVCGSWRAQAAAMAPGAWARSGRLAQ